MILAMALAAGTAPPQIRVTTVQQRAQATARCPMNDIRHAQARAPLPRAHPLDQEPTARQEIAVQVTDADGCTRPIVVREDVGG